MKRERWVCVWGDSSFGTLVRRLRAIIIHLIKWFGLKNGMNAKGA